MTAGPFDRMTSLILPLALSLLVVTARHATSPFAFEVTFKASTPGTVQLFYDPTGAAHLSEPDSARFHLNQVDTAITHRFPLPEGTYSWFRFDPIDRQGTVTFSGARIVRSSPWTQDQVVRNIPVSRFLAANQIVSLKTSAEEAQLVTSEHANHPMLVVLLESPLRLKEDRTRALLESGRPLVVIWFLAWLFFRLINQLQMRSQASFARGWQRMVPWAHQHHVRAISLVAIFAAVLSCYPVVLFGKSFLSPDNGTPPLLYGQDPTLPGNETTGIEDVKGADIGAPMWEFLAYSVVESHAILGNAELPLWNRFNSAGATLMGQGMSMLGDPLHLCVIIAGGASWAWDIKFVVAKTLFALALGLIVFACTRHLPASLVLTFSSAYIGFFAYRFSHPAFFSLAYGPWILYCWIRVVQSPSHQSDSQVRWLGGLVLANWMVINSGTAKEAYMLLIFLNLTGALVFLLHQEEGRIKWQKGIRLLLAEALFVMISAPIWVTFLEAIQKSYSAYGTPAAVQISPTLFIGFFDDIFYRQLIPAEWVYAPSANFLMLAGLLWAAVRFRQLSADPIFLGIGLGAGITLSFVFGVVPAAVITQIPFLRNVIHIHNTFSVVAIVHLVVLAGFGVKACCDRFAGKQWPIEMAFTVAMLGILLVLFFHAAQAANKSAFFVSYGAAIVIAAVALPILSRRVTLRPASPELWFLLMASFIALHWRHGMYLKTGFDDYVMNPQVRVNLQPQSPAIQFVRRDARQPFRTVGFNDNLFPGYNAALGIESIYGCDALMNPFFRELTRLMPFEWNGDWRLLIPKQSLKEVKPIYDLLNVDRYVDLPNGDPQELPGLTFDGRFDLDVYRSHTAWPRAFYTNQLATYSSAREFVTWPSTARAILSLRSRIPCSHRTLRLEPCSNRARLESCRLPATS